MTISREQWIEWIDNDIDKIIALLNLGVSPSLILPEITIANISGVSDTISNRHPLTCQCCRHCDVITTTLLVSLIDRLDQLKPEVLEPLVRHFRYSAILDRIFRLKLINNIKNLVNDNLIPETANYAWLAVELKDDELIDLVMELHLNGDIKSCHITSNNYATSFIMGALEYNYLYPLKYITPESLKKCLIGMRIDIELLIDQQGLDQVIELIGDGSHNDDRLLNELIYQLMLSGRVDSAIPLLGRLADAKLNDSRSRWRASLPLSNFDNEEHYYQVMGCEFKIDLKTMLAVIRGDYAGLAKTVTDRLTDDQLSMILAIHLLSGDNDHIGRLGMIKRITELIDLESFQQLVANSISQYQKVVDQCPTAEDYQLLMTEELGMAVECVSLEQMYRMLLTATIITIRDKDSKRVAEEREHDVKRVVEEYGCDDDEIITPISIGLSQEEKDRRDLRYNSVPDKIMVGQQSYGCDDQITTMMSIMENRRNGVKSVVNDHLVMLRQLLGLIE